MDIVGLTITAISTIVVGVVWGVRLEGRVNTHDQIFAEREKQGNDRYEEIIRRLDRIEKKQDNNGQRREA
jgi:hypothetical protein